MTTPEIASVLASKILFNTFGGNPVCSAGGLAVLNVIDKEKRQAHCAEVGSHLIQRLKDLQKRHDSKYQTIFLDQMVPLFLLTYNRVCLVSVIGDVRGRGLMVGIELVSDRKDKTPAKAETAVLFEQLRGKETLKLNASILQVLEHQLVNKKCFAPFS